MNDLTTLIIVAGGKSKRMGMPKGLLKKHRTFWILEQMTRFHNKDIYIGLGYDASIYLQEIPWFKKALTAPVVFQNKKVRVVINRQPVLGFFSTFQAVLKQIASNKNQNDVVVLPVDVPLLKSDDLMRFLQTHNDVVIPVYKGEKGHPVKIAFSVWNTFLRNTIEDKELRLDVQLKKIPLAKTTYVTVNDNNCLLNLNTPLEWQQFIATYS